MRNLTLKYAVVAALFGAMGIDYCKAQDPVFSQFYANPIYLNPAFAGSAVCPRIALNYRNQWPSIPGQFVTYSAAYDQYFSSLNGGLGFNIWQDQAGDGTLNTLNISAMYAYTVQVTRDFSLKFGLEASYFQKTIDWDKLTFGDMIDSRYGFIYPTQETEGAEKVNNADFTAGVLGYTEFIFAGVTVHHLSEPNESFYGNYEGAKLLRRYTAHAGATLPFDMRNKEDGYWSPNILYTRQGEMDQINVGLYVKKGPFVGGLWYRFEDAFIALVGLETEQFRFGYSYDLTTSQLTNEPGGGHEISLGFLLPCPKPRVKRRMPPCPHF